MVVLREASSAHRSSAFCSVPLCNNAEMSEKQASPVKLQDLAWAEPPTLDNAGANQPAIASFGPGSFAESISPVHEEKQHPQ